MARWQKRGMLAHGRRTCVLVLLMLSILLFVGVADVAGTGRNGDAIDRYVTAQVQAGRIPGVAIAIVRDGRIASLRSYGIAGPDGRPMTPQTPMAVGSISKPLTAVAVLQLVEQGKLDLDTPIQKYLPWFRLADTAAAERITVRHLLAQTSGFSTQQGRAGLAHSNLSDDALERAGRDLSMLSPITAPGARWQYSNVNYTLLGLLVQTVAGVPYEQYMQEQVFAPLAMHNSYARPDVAQRHGMAVGYRYWFDRPVPEPNPPYSRGISPAINMVVSAEDLANFLVAQLNGGQYDGRQMLRPESVAGMHRPAAATGVEGISYGFGLGIDQTSGSPVLAHGGDTANFHSEIIFSPIERWGVVVLINANSSLAPTAASIVKALSFGVAEQVAGRPVVSPATGENNPYMALVVILSLLIAIQSGRFAETVVHFRRSQRRSNDGARFRFRQIASLAIDVTLAWGMLVGLPVLLITPLDTIIAYQPDIGWLLVGVGALSLIGGALRLVQAATATNVRSEPLA